MDFLLSLIFRLILEVPIIRVFSLAVLPALFLLYKVQKMDRLEPEPPKLIWSLVGLGCLSTLLAMVIEIAGVFLLVRIVEPESLLFDILQFFLVVGLGEEFSKLLMLRLRTWKDPAFNCMYDGMVYAVAVSAGFALLENIMYVFRYGASVVFIRAIVSIPAHICMAVLMGTWYSAAKAFEHRGDKESRKRSMTLALLVPAAAHGGFDLIATHTDSAAGWIVFLLYIAAMFYVSWRLCKRMAGRDRYFSEEIQTIRPSSDEESHP